MHVEMPVFICACKEQKEQRFHEECKTIHVDPHGALLAVATKLVPGQSLLLVNPESRKQMVCHIRSVIPIEPGVNHVEIEFSKKSPKFWGIEFPTVDETAAQDEPSQNRGVPSAQESFADESLIYTPECGGDETPDHNAIARDRKEVPEMNAAPHLKSPSESEAGGASTLQVPQPKKEATEVDNGESHEVAAANVRHLLSPVRRAPRVRLVMSVLISFPGESEFSEAKTLEINDFGALLSVSRNMEVGQYVILKNPKSLQEIKCEVRNMKEVDPDENHLGVEFLTPSNRFWGMTFPSDDWDPSERKPVQRPAPVTGQVAGRSSKGRSKINRGSGSEATTLPKNPDQHGHALRWLALAVVVILGFAAIARFHWSDAMSGIGVNSIFQEIPSEDASLIPGVGLWRLATARDFNPAAISWLKNSGQQVSAQITGAFSAVGQSHAYVLIGKDKTRRIVILANGRLRCDLEIQGVAIVARVPKQSVQKIHWAILPPANYEGDGLLVVRAANDPGSGEVLFLRGHQVVSGAPVDYRQVPLS